MLSKIGQRVKNSDIYSDLSLRDIANKAKRNYSYTYLAISRMEKIALVHDYLIQYGGAERVLEEFLEMYPEAPVYTLVYNPKTLPDRLQNKLKGREIFTSSLQKFPFSKTKHQYYLWMMPFFVEQWDFSWFDVVLSDTTSFAKGIICPPQTKHICYCHTPLRYGWDLTHHYQKNYPYPWLVRKIMPPFLLYLRIWDRAAAQRPDIILCNSQFVKKRIKKYYHKKPQVVHPPVEISCFKKYQREPKNYYLMVSRFIPYKRIDLAIQAFNKLQLPLKIVGEGPEYKKLKQIAQNNIEFLGPVYGRTLKELYASCKGFVMPQKEDFGLAPLEVMASGRPVIAFKAGGALDYIQEGVNGIFFEPQTPKALMEAIKKFNKKTFNPQEITESVKKFDKSAFRSKIKKVVADH